MKIELSEIEARFVLAAIATTFEEGYTSLGEILTEDIPEFLPLVERLGLVANLDDDEIAQTAGLLGGFEGTGGLSQSVEEITIALGKGRDKQL